jgi:hypothetical protein
MMVLMTFLWLECYLFVLIALNTTEQLGVCVCVCVCVCARARVFLFQRRTEKNLATFFAKPVKKSYT